MGHSCRTLLWALLRDTLVGHSHTTLTYRCIFDSSEATAPSNCFPHYICTTKLPVLQLPEADCRTTLVLPSGQFSGHSSQKLHLHYQVDSSELPYYMCTTKWPVLKAQLPGAASHIAFSLQVVHPCGTLLRDTLVGHSCGHSCRTLSSDTLVGHSCMAFLWDTLAGHS